MKTKQEKNKQNNKYRASVYLGEELYKDIAQMSKFLGIPTSTLIRTMLQVGFTLSKSMERSFDYGNTRTKK